MAVIDNKITIYPQNTTSFGYNITNLIVTGYTPYITVKKKTTDSDYVIDVSGLVQDSSTITFILSSTDTSLNYGDYVYDITLEVDASKYTVVKDKFIVVDGVRY